MSTKTVTFSSSQENQLLPTPETINNKNNANNNCNKNNNRGTIHTVPYVQLQ